MADGEGEGVTCYGCGEGREEMMMINCGHVFCDSCISKNKEVCDRCGAKKYTEIKVSNAPSSDMKRFDADPDNLSRKKARLESKEKEIIFQFNEVEYDFSKVSNDLRKAAEEKITNIRLELEKDTRNLESQVEYEKKRLERHLEETRGEIDRTESLVKLVRNEWYKAEKASTALTQSRLPFIDPLEFNFKTPVMSYSRYEVGVVGALFYPKKMILLCSGQNELVLDLFNCNGNGLMSTTLLNRGIPQRIAMCDDGLVVIASKRENENALFLFDPVSVKQEKMQTFESVSYGIRGLFYDRKSKEIIILDRCLRVFDFPTLEHKRDIKWASHYTVESFCMNSEGVIYVYCAPIGRSINKLDPIIGEFTDVGIPLDEIKGIRAMYFDHQDNLYLLQHSSRPAVKVYSKEFKFITSFNLDGYGKAKSLDFHPVNGSVLIWDDKNKKINWFGMKKRLEKMWN